MTEIINRVANSPIITIDLENFYRKEQRVVFDLKDFLFQGMVLKEKDFRNALKNFDWNLFKGKLVAVTCSEDAIVPTWAFMLVGTYLGKFDIEYVIGDLASLEQFLFEKELSEIDPELYRDRPVVVKGCSKYPVPFYAYGRVVSLLQPFAKSIMYGEPCSTVPLYKRDKK
ncbi:MAG: DUF2480 family protein [Mongoliibacter sp.]|uniref:DUF2480 family protein n=1 Tax=Mongoliibacter sp. TaxID=2022438 RepID=UPI0012F2193D|nr:DUF2480 family protein [Mongoliibacter sp.]TVP43058.1 MAG: DUF2480 family protein [Mongoliibacter sp.]